MALKIADFSDALAGITQTMLDSTPEPTDAHRMQNVAYLKIGVLHGVSVEIEDALNAAGDIPTLVRDGLVIRCLIPRGTDLELLRLSLAGGELARLIQTVLKGHVLDLTPDGGVGSLSRGAARARETLLSTLSDLASGAVMPALTWPTARSLPMAALESTLRH